MCGEMVTLNRGVSCDVLNQVAEEFFVQVVAPRIFSELQTLTRRLAAEGCELWAVSSTNHWVVEAGARRFGISGPHSCSKRCVEDGRATERLLRVPTDELKWWRYAR